MDVCGSGLVETTVVVAGCLTCLGLGLTVLWFIRTVGKRLSLWRVAWLPSLELWCRERLSRRVSSVVAA